MTQNSKGDLSGIAVSEDTFHAILILALAHGRVNRLDA
jgi:hypothetical protein